MKSELSHYTIPQTKLIHPPTYITYKDTRFLIIDAPSTNNLHLYIEVGQKEKERKSEGWMVIRCSESMTKIRYRSLNASTLQTSSDAANQHTWKKSWWTKASKSMTGHSMMVTSHLVESSTHGSISCMNALELRQYHRKRYLRNKTIIHPVLLPIVWLA